MARRWVAALTAIAGAGMAVLAPAAHSASLPGPPYSVATASLAANLHCPASLPHRGKPSVLLVHGTSVTDEENWSWNYRPALRALGFDVCTVLLPDRALMDIQVTSEYVVYALRTMAQRGHRKVSVVGVSQGALQPRWALRWWPDIRHLVEDYVSMAGTNHGSSYGAAACTGGCAPALWQQRQEANFLRVLNAGDETPGDVDYTSVYSLTDPIIQPSAPVATAALDGASNIAVQSLCPGRPVDHIQSVWDAVYWHVVLDALTHPGPADPGRIPATVCLEAAMPGVDPVDGVVKIPETYLLAAQVQAAYPKVGAEPPLKPYARSAASRPSP